MKIKYAINWIRLCFMITGLFLIMALKTAHADSPFRADDFVIMPDLISGLNGKEIQKHEISYAQYNALHSQLPRENQKPWGADDCGLKRDIKKEKYNSTNYPATCISFNDAEAYIRVLNTLDNKYEYRLLTQKEFTQLVNLTFSVITNNNSKVSVAQINKYAWIDSYSTSNNHPHPVCTKISIFGLCDILGNLWEWTSPEATDSAPLVFGGGWDHSAMYLTSSLRFSQRNIRSFIAGFRLVRTAKNF